LKISQNLGQFPKTPRTKTFAICFQKSNMLLIGLNILSSQKFFQIGYPNEKVCIWICLTVQSQMTRSALTILFWVIYVWLLKDSTDFFSAYLSARAIYVWLCRDFDFYTEQCSAENRPTFGQVCSAVQGQIFSLG
jgi:hypothetical protein